MAYKSFTSIGGVYRLSSIGSLLYICGPLKIARRVMAIIIYSIQ